MSRFTQLNERRQDLLDDLATALPQTAPDADPLTVIRRFASTPPLHRAVTAPLYTVSSDVCALILSSIETLPNFDVAPELFPTASGFMILEQAFGYITDEGPSDFVAAYCWEIVDESRFTTKPGTAIELATLMDTGHSSRGIVALSYEPLPFLWDQPRNYESGEAPDHQSQASIDLSMRLFAALLAFINQELIVETKAHSADRGDKRRAQRARMPEPQPAIEVVLRRAKAGTESARSVDWHHRWIVRGHWRQQPYGPNSALRRPRFIPPYVKGPEGAPLLAPRDPVFRVER